MDLYNSFKGQHSISYIYICQLYLSQAEGKRDIWNLSRVGGIRNKAAISTRMQVFR